ncbi:MAG: aminotransferase class III-fold pyridoxal phosphate-dependent enzyme, partial [Candidatus Rokubacteria bacterium]|nr:aminotransferase class III-fold pyridoxal phosphate-dependent enzyme [Candidatus Rokubacteria bacterium]
MNRMRSVEENGLLEKAAKVFPGGVLGRHRLADAYKVVFSHGRGAHLFDMSGREYIDYTCGGGALLLGYVHPEIAEAIRDQLSRASQFISILNIQAIEYAAELLEVIPCGEQIRFANSGSEGTFYALRLARAFTGRDKILKFEGAYHGHHDYAMWSYAP